MAVSDGNVFLSQTWGSWAAAPNWLDVRAGDFNGDGRDDMVARDGTTGGGWQLALSTGTSFTNQVWDTSTIAWVDVQVGDANWDGKDDLVGHISGSSDWWVGLSTGSGFLHQNQDWANWFVTTEFQGGQQVDFDAQLRTALGAFESVRNNVEFQPYPGLMKGAQATDETRAGNAWDQAALLVQMLESSAIDARFTTAQIDAPIQDIMQWLGVTVPGAAINVLASGGSSVVCVPTCVSPTSLRFDHAWVEAWLPGAAGFQWTALDPSWKLRAYQPGITNIVGLVPFNESDYLSQTRTQLAYEYYEDQVAAYLERGKGDILFFHCNPGRGAVDSRRHRLLPC